MHSAFYHRSTLYWEWGGGVLNKILYVEAAPRSNPLPLYFERNGTSFVYLLLPDGTPFTYTPSFKYDKIPKSGSFLLDLLQTAMTDFPTLSWTSISEILTLKPEIGTPFRRSLPSQTILGSSPRPWTGCRSMKDNITQPNYSSVAYSRTITRI